MKHLILANSGANAITDQIELLIPVAASVIGVAVLVVVIPWGAKMAINAFKDITDPEYKSYKDATRWGEYHSFQEWKTRK